MYEFIKLTESTYYIESPAKVGVILLPDNEAVLIDSGNDKDAGKKILKILAANGRTLSAVFNTHYHADHIGGNRYLETNTSCRIYAPGMEQAFTKYPILEPTLLWGGDPPAELRHKFLLAQESGALPLTPDILPEGIEAVPLPGHSPHMTGFKTSDGILFLADCLSSETALEKYGIGFIADIGTYLSTLEAVKGMDAALFVPSHAPVTDNIAPLAQLNIDKVMEIGDRITDICIEPRMFEDILRKLFSAYGMSMTFEQYALVGSTLRSYLTWLSSLGRITAEIEDARMLWRKV